MGVSLKPWLVAVLLALFLWPAGASAKGEHSDRRERGASSMRSSKKAEGKRARRENRRRRSAASKRARRAANREVDDQIRAHLQEVASLPPDVTAVDEPPPPARPAQKQYVQPVDQYDRLLRVGRDIDKMTRGR